MSKLANRLHGRGGTRKAVQIPRQSKTLFGYWKQQLCLKIPTASTREVFKMVTQLSYGLSLLAPQYELRTGPKSVLVYIRLRRKRYINGGTKVALAKSQVFAAGGLGELSDQFT